ncbi:Mediator of RNA polymerase II transcription subunit 20 [Geodia barretti]|uniref:Mediator of RNA polymerase II transcription subunit 20 n=1 Tax=Geodia barretti TaxID=519541 RepID=A0AA35SLI2_GEOBA|nr:Mediator of RNA polymerase II transcription subunit 20 [Geodia barretti]
MANVIHSSEYPRSTFLILDNLQCLVAENSLDTILSHLKQFYPPRKQPRIEVKGKIYLAKQYAIKFGAISMGSVNKGIVVEVEDKDQSRVSQCWSELTAFTKGLLDSSQPMDVPMFARQSDRPYLPSDSMSHYAFIFEQLRKTPSVTGAIK